MGIQTTKIISMFAGIARYMTGFRRGGSFLSKASSAMLMCLFVLAASTVLFSGNSASAATKAYYIKTVGVPNAMSKYVQVADFGFFDPASTNTPYYLIKKHKKKSKVVKARKKKNKLPKYSLGHKNYKSYLKSYNDKNGADFDGYYNIKPKKRYIIRSSKTYRTMCVRLKDGFYWPISFARRKSSFRKDRIKCQKSCSGKVRLFYYPSTSAKIELMRDMKGRRYTSLKTAFLYRKTYVKAANCKPKPWSAEAKAVHKKYAAFDTEKKRRLHIAHTKRAEKRRVAALNRSVRKYRKRKYRHRRKRRAKYSRRKSRAYRRKRYKL